MATIKRLELYPPRTCVSCLARNRCTFRKGVDAALSPGIEAGVFDRNIPHPVPVDVVSIALGNQCDDYEPDVDVVTRIGIAHSEPVPLDPDIAMIQLDPSRSCYSCTNHRCHLRKVIGEALGWGTGVGMLNLESPTLAPATFQAAYAAIANACLEYDPLEEEARLMARATQEEETP